MDDVRRAPTPLPRRKHQELIIEEEALTLTQVMAARGYERDPDSGSWRLSI